MIRALVRAWRAKRREAVLSQEITAAFEARALADLHDAVDAGTAAPSVWQLAADYWDPPAGEG